MNPTEIRELIGYARYSVQEARHEPMSPAESSLCDAIEALIRLVEHQNFGELDAHKIAARIAREGLTDTGEPDITKIEEEGDKFS